MSKPARLNIDAIALCLYDAQRNFDQINATLTVRRKPPSDEVIENLLEGYRLIDAYVSSDTDVFAMGRSDKLLTLNHTVLYHNADISAQEKAEQFEATRAHFYQEKGAGIGGLMEWMALHYSSSIWKRTAGMFTHMLSRPQLFIEGNHRTGSLIMSYMLMRAGRSPFVLSAENARHFFEPAEMTKKRHKKALLDEYLYLPKQTRRFAKLLKTEQSKRFLL